MERLAHSVSIDRVAGSHFEIGKKLGEKTRAEKGPDFLDKDAARLKGDPLLESVGFQFDLSPEYIEEVFPVVEATIRGVHSGLLDELKGFAEGAGETYERYATYTCNFGPKSGCSQLFINGVLARNYDDKPGSVPGDFLLTEPEGSNKSFGSALDAERFDGINDKGLAVSLTFSAGYPPSGHGIGAPMYQRIVLDKASTVGEALEIFENAPYVSPNNVLIGDVDGNSAVIEVSGGAHKVRKNTKGGTLYCANSFLDPEMQAHQKIKNPTTKWREKIMREMSLRDENEILDLLTSDFPDGLFEPYFNDGLGTLWSVIYDTKTQRVWLAVGEKNHERKTVTFDLSNSLSFKNLPKRIEVTVPNIPLTERLPAYR